MSEAGFAKNAAAADAVCWCLSCIGEAAGAIRRAWPSLEHELPELQLASAYAMRNRISHGYASIDLGVVWQTATVSVPLLVNAAEAVLNARSG
jgi:uncharacterized protein with HEPN domain